LICGKIGKWGFQKGFGLAPIFANTIRGAVYEFKN